ncbi:MAG TPA: Gfo/Idh/MocA family oxidoreductase [Candidatus Pullichristensenella excrementipullorum]|nr:Gfo/Idh/MocA family oxidoreductase [Candidatus Pullichristensenella excrementipullorum]
MAAIIRYGMVGGGMKALIGEVHRKALKFDNRVELVAGCFSSHADRNAEVGVEYGLDPARVYANYEEMAKAEAAREDGIDFVSVVTPNNTHYAVCKAFLEAGINVVCEKPLCFTVEQAEELQKLSREKGLLFGVTYTYTGYVMSKVMKEMIAEGKIGKVVSVNAEYAQDWLLGELATGNNTQTNIAVWRTDPAVSGAANCVGDIGTHIENYVHYVTGLKIKRLVATTNKYGKALDLNANIIVEYENGVNGAYWCSQVAAGHYNGLAVRVYGDKGALEWAQEDPEHLRYTPMDGATQLLARGTGCIKEKAAAQGRLPSGHPEGLVTAFANIYRNYVSALVAKKNGADAEVYDYPRVEDGVNGVRFVKAVVESAANGSTWVEV